MTTSSTPAQQPITAHQFPIARIFSDDYVFSVPNYQRPYAWTTEQAGELIDDLTDFMKDHPGDVDKMPPYFMGSVILKKQESNPAADIVDGQQRLTTLTILLSAIRADVEGESKGEITSFIYAKGKALLGTPDRFRLSLRKRDNDFFQRYVQREDGFAELLKLDRADNDSQTNILKNAKLFAERLAKLSNENRLRLAQFIVTRCYLVAVATPDLDSAYRIFTVLNNRGLDLSATDILKAEIIGALPEKEREAYNKKWEDSEEDLGREAFGDLFSHIRMVYRKAKPQGTLLKEFKDHVSKDVKPAKVVDDIVLPMAEVYAFLTTNTYESSEGAEKVNESLKWLNRLEFTDWIPPALRFAVGARHTPSKMVMFFADLERLAYWMLLTKAGINDRMDRFAKLTTAIEAGQDLRDTASPMQLSAAEQQQALNTLFGPIYDTLAARARTTVVLRLDALLSGGGATYDYATITLEHVMPQTPKPGSCWEKWIPDETKRQTYVHQLGNLALLTRKKNSSASNYDFDKKKTAYFARNGVSPFTITTQVLAHAEWTEKIITDRQSQLLKTLKDHWRLEGATNRDELLDQLLS